MFRWLRGCRLRIASCSLQIRLRYREWSSLERQKQVGVGALVGWVLALPACLPACLLGRQAAASSFARPPPSMGDIC